MRRPMLIAAALASMSTAALAGETITYSYDARGRLVKVAHSGTVNTGVSTTYAFDKADNRTSVTTAGSTGGTGTGGTGTGGTGTGGTGTGGTGTGGTGTGGTGTGGTGTGSTGTAGTQPRYIVVPLTGGTLIPISS